MGIEVETAATRKARERDARLFSKLDRQARWRRHRADDRDTCHPGLLHNLEGGAAAHDQGPVTEWHSLLQQHSTDHLVDSIVPPHIFGRRFARTARGVKRSGVEAT